MPLCCKKNKTDKLVSRPDPGEMTDTSGLVDWSHLKRPCASAINNNFSNLSGCQKHWQNRTTVNIILTN